jgi:cytochrome c nitrite reductase small subunit
MALPGKNDLLRLVAMVMPPSEWRLPVMLVIAVVCGLGLHIFHVSRAWSYISDDSEVCMNCHVMTTQFATWERGSHARVSNCNGCHVPQDNVVRKYAFKGMDGARHTAMFTFRLEPQVIRIKEAGVGAVQENCVRCHKEMVSLVRSDEGELCWRCHRETPHGRVNSLAAAPFARVPKLSKVLPTWLEDLMEKEKKNSGI